MPRAGLAAAVTSVLLGLRFVLAGVFARAGIAKLVNLPDFRVAITNYEIVPARLEKGAALAVPVVETIAAALLLLGILTSMAAWLLGALLAGFAMAIAINLARGRVFDCGCGGTAPRRISWPHVVVNLLLAAAAVAVALAPPSALVLASGPGGVFSLATPREAGLPVLLAVALGLVMAALLRAVMALRGQLRALRS